MPTRNFFPQDPKSGAPPNIDVVHKNIHSEKVWTASHAVSVGTATAVSVLLQTPSGSTVYHCTFSVEATNAGTWTFSESPNASGGTAVTAYNHDRASTLTNPITVTHTVTFVSAGNIIESHCIGSSGIGSSSGGGSGLVRNEYILSADKLYLFKLSALNAATNVAMNVTYYKGGA